MTNLDIYDFALECTFADNIPADIDRQVALLLSTVEGSMPLAREFGINMDFVDMPIETAKSLYTAEVTKKIPKFIPCIRVHEVKWAWDYNGKLTPKVVLTSA